MDNDNYFIFSWFLSLSPYNIVHIDKLGQACAKLNKIERNKEEVRVQTATFLICQSYPCPFISYPSSNLEIQL